MKHPAALFAPRLLVAVAGVLFGIASRADAADFYVSPAGNDADPGTLEKPFATVQRAQDAVTPGDTVHIRGGTYAMTEARIATKRRGFAYVTHLSKSGTPDKRITYQAYKDERPVFDLSAVNPKGMRIDAFYVPASWVHIKGLEVVGVQVTATAHTQSICFANDGSHNVYERLSMHDGMAIGIYSVKGSDNLFLNCDAYNNHDPVSEGGKGGNVDGFGCHPVKGATGNVFRGCRAWFNSDDGYDCINAHEAVTFEGCWAMYNGFSPQFKSLADGNGFKAGGYGSTPAEQTPKPPPRHVVRFCVAVGNKANGFYSNHHLGGSDWTNNTAYRNGNNYNMLCRQPDNVTDVDGFGHKLRNNLGYRSRSPITKIDRAKCDASHNTFDLDLKLADKDFASLDEGEMFRPRRADGSLPAMGFLHPAEGAAFVGKGVDAGFPFKGTAPTLGAFER